MALLNKFNRQKWRSSVTSETALNSTKARNLTISDTNIDNYGPFTRFRIDNKNTTITIQVDINGQALGDDSINGSVLTKFVLPDTFIEINPDQDPDLQFTRISIKNLHAANNTAAGDIVWSIANY